MLPPNPTTTARPRSKQLLRPQRSMVTDDYIRESLSCTRARTFLLAHTRYYCLPAIILDPVGPFLHSIHFASRPPSGTLKAMLQTHRRISISMAFPVTLAQGPHRLAPPSLCFLFIFLTPSKVALPLSVCCCFFVFFAVNRAFAAATCFSFCATLIPRKPHSTPLLFL